MRGYCVCLCALAGCVSLWSTPALATEVHVYKSSFGSPGAGSGQLTRPAGVAVNDATHDVYVVDNGNNRVEKFDSAGSTILCEFNGSPSAPTGAFSEPTEIAVDNSGNPLDPSNEDVYVVDRGHGVIDKFDSSCTYVGQVTGAGNPTVPFQEGEDEPPRAIQGVTIDSNGSLWVSVQNGPIYNFSDALENKYSSERSTAFGGALEGLAIDSKDNLYFNVGSGKFAKVNAAGETLISPIGGDEKAFRVAVDPIGDEVYLDNIETIEAFNLSGAPIESCLGALRNCFGGGLLEFSKGVAVDASNGTVYVTDQTADKVLIFEGITLPSVTIGRLSEQHTKSVTLNGIVSPEEREVTSCVFEYGTTTAYGQSVPCSPASLGSGKTPVPVSAHLEGLVPETEYHYRLVAKNAAPVSNPTPDQTFFTGPLLSGEYVVDVASSSATLKVPIDPNGGETHYYLEYGQTAAYGNYAPLPPPGNNLGSAVGEQKISLHIQNLEAATSYHYRFVAIQDNEAFEESDHVFTTQNVSTATLPDGRAWELVSPVNKKGVLIELLESGGQVQAAMDGGGISYLTDGASISANPAGKIELAQVLSRRGAAGWNSVDLTLPNRLTGNEEAAGELFHPQFEYRLFSPDLSRSAVEPQQLGTPPLSPGVTERTLYLRDNATKIFSPLVSAANVPFGTKIEEPLFVGLAASEFEMHFLAATPDLNHVVFKTPMALTPGAIDEENIEDNVPGRVQWNLYEWSGGRLQLVNILPAPGEEVAHGRAPTVPPVRLAGTTSAAGLGRGGAQRSVSEDGRRIAWTWGDPYAEPTQYAGLYVRDMVEESTVRVGGATAVYQTMNSDGSKIFFLENGDLYEYDFNTETKTDLTESHGSGESSANVQEVVSDVSEDGSYIYFVAKGILASGAASDGNNMYLLHDKGSSGWTLVYIATLSDEDKPTWYGENDGAPFLAAMGSRVSPNGRYLAFMSNHSLTGYDNTDAVTGEPDEEVYLYDAQQGKLVCASCDPTGARPTGVLDDETAELFVDRPGNWTARHNTGKNKGTNHRLAGSIPGWDNLNNSPATYQPRYLSNSGRLFFDSPIKLASQDTNGLEDVYEYEPEGIPTNSLYSCAKASVTFSESADGCIGLVSSGTSGAESAFYDASDSGNDVFFATTGKLVGEDYDKGYDVYDAHVCSDAVPCPAASKPPLQCTSSDSCKAAPSLQPDIFGAPPSATFNGVGNVPAAKPKSLTMAQRLAHALRVCREKKAKRRRHACERQARRTYLVKTDRKVTAAVNRRRGR